MYSPQYDTPPPQSQFRRPWSPDPYDPSPSAHRSRSQQPPLEAYFQGNSPFDYDNDPPQHSYRQRQRREASDVSVEALDLADYAMTMRGNHHYNNYQNYPEDMYPPSPPSQRPLSRDSLATTPSLVSRVNTLSSNSHSGRTPRRPFSLPPQSRGNASSPPSAYSRYPAFADPRFTPQQPNEYGSDTGIDVGQFPAWSRNWYNNKKTEVPPSPPDIYTSLPRSHRDIFDPGNEIHHGYNQDFPYQSTPYGSSAGHESSRNLVPWSNDPRDYGPSIDSTMKEERIRMLEREFGPNSKAKRPADTFVDESGKPMIGTVDDKGNLVTHGPKKRLTLRLLQILLALAAAIPAIYAATMIKVTGRETPPPSGKPATYVLYVLSVLTVLALIFLFLIYPCCCGRRKKSKSGNPLAANGMMVLPVQSMPRGKKGGKHKGGKKGKKGQPIPGDVQVNLIVDPAAFRRDEPESDEDEDDGDWDGSMPGGYSNSNTSQNKRRNRAQKRRSVFAGLQMEEQWKRARAWLKKITVFDVFGIIVWGAVFVLIMLGPRCPSGSFNGWCNAFNTSTAASCLLCVAFGFSLFFDVKDLNASKASPRTRT